MLVKTPYPESHLAFGQKLLSSFGALWTPDPLYLANVSSYNKQLDLGRISSPPNFPPGHRPSLAPICSTSPHLGFSPASSLAFSCLCFLWWGLMLKSVPTLWFCEHIFYFEPTQWSSTLALPLFPALSCPLSSTQPSPTQPPPTKSTSYLLLP